MKILLTGGTGQLGWELRRTLAPLGRVEAPGRKTLDLAEPDAIRAAVRNCAPDLVVNAAAWTDVDAAEAEPERAAAINARAPGVLAEAAAQAGAFLVHFSTDYVFGGDDAPYSEGDEPGPVNAYGDTKLAGERAVRESGVDHLILRSSWIYGLRRKNFLTTMWRLFTRRERVEVVDDQVGSPTWCRLLAGAAAVAIARREEASGGTYHLACRGSASRHAFAAAIRDGLELIAAAREDWLFPPPSGARSAAMVGDPQEGSRTAGEREGRFRGAFPLVVRRIESVSTEAYVAGASQPADRPADTTLATGKAEAAFGLALPGWREALALCLEGLSERTEARRSDGDRDVRHRVSEHLR